MFSERPPHGASSRRRSVQYRYLNLEKKPGAHLQTLRFACRLLSRWCGGQESCFDQDALVLKWTSSLVLLRTVGNPEQAKRLHRKCQHRASGVRFADAEALVAQTAGVKWVLRNYQKWKVVPVQQPVREEPQLVMAS